MPKRKSIENQDAHSSPENDAKSSARKKIERLCKCEKILSDSDSDILGFGDISKFKDHDDWCIEQSDECNDELEEEHLRLMRKMNLTHDTHSLTRIEMKLPACMKYAFRSGLIHMNMKKFSPLSRGYQGPAIAVAAIATSHLIKPDCWNEVVIDQVIEDGDAYFGSSYKLIKTDDRGSLTLLDLKRELDVRKSHRSYVRIDDPICCGTFNSDSPTELHVAKALEIFFKKYDAGVLTSSVLNIAIWKSSSHFNVFDGQARLENCEVPKSEDQRDRGAAKLILLNDLAGILFIILKKSNVQNEPFVIYGVIVESLKELSSLPDDEDEVHLEEPKRRPSGYRIQDKYRAVVRGSYHLHHELLPAEFHGRGHLVLAAAALVYSKLLSASKWTKAMLDVIFNQSNVYLADLARVLGKPLDDTFELRPDELLSDLVLGVYTAKLKLRENVFPGQGKKSKAAMGPGLREYFEKEVAGVLEMKKQFYATWREDNKYYFFDPFGCDEQGFRLLESDGPESLAKAAACVTMNSSIEQLVETILVNTDSKEKDPFFIHGIDVLYVKTGSKKDGSDEQVVYRAKRIKRRAQREPTPPPEIDECAKVIDSLPRPRAEQQRTPNESSQQPEPMDRVDKFVEVFDEKKCPYRDTRARDREGRLLSTYKIASPRRLLLEGTRNCFSGEFIESSRGRQGLVAALAAIATSKTLQPAEWTSAVLDEIVLDANASYEQLVLRMHGEKSEDGLDEEKSKSLLAMGLEHLELSMLPESLAIGNAEIGIAHKSNVAAGESNPLANLGEALERCFELFDELVLENRKLSYAVWRENKKYFAFNPYGSDKCGWRDNAGPAVLAVLDGLLELVDFLYGILEPNDYHFALHNVRVTPTGVELPDDVPDYPMSLEPYEKYATKFLPITDADLHGIRGKGGRKSGFSEDGEDGEFGEDGEDGWRGRGEGRSGLDGGDEEDELECKREDAFAFRLSTTAEGEEHEGGEGSGALYSVEGSYEEGKYVQLTRLVGKIGEPVQPNPPARLNLALITGVVKLQLNDEAESFEKLLEVFYEKLKYRQPPPFVAPPLKNLCDLLDSKLASKSMHSLISRFSIDSKLAIKQINDLPALQQLQDATINFTENTDKSKLITLPPKNYLFSRSLPSGLTPIRAIDEAYIQNKELDKQQEEDCRRKKELEKSSFVMIPGETVDESTGVVLPVIIPLGPCLKTPKFKRKLSECPEKRKKKCPLSAKEQEDYVLRKIVCGTENVLLELLLPEFKEQKPANEEKEELCDVKDEKIQDIDTTTEASIASESCGFSPTDHDDIGIIQATSSLKDRETTEECHYKSCYFAAILCVLAKINVDAYDLRGSVLDRFVHAANKIGDGIPKLRIKMTRCFRNFNILDVRYDVIVKQFRYADPENHKPDSLCPVLEAFFARHRTGILVLGNASYAFWYANDAFFVFDPYGCDENGRAVEQDGNACLMRICDFGTFVDRIAENSGENADKPYRLYTVSIAHLEEKRKKRKSKKKRRKSCKEERQEQKVEEDECGDEEKELESNTESLIELADWTREEDTDTSVDCKLPGFLPVKNYKASAIEVEVLENEITRPILAPLKPVDEGNTDRSKVELERWLPYDRKYFENSALAEPMDLCVIAWSQIYEPVVWSVRTIKALGDASREYALNSGFAAEDSSLLQMWDDLLTEFNVANNHFRVVFAPMHVGVLYANEGWNLAMSLRKIFESTIYSGAVIVCGSAHVGVMRRGERFYAWWCVRKTKRIRIVVSEDMEDYLKIIVREINEPKETPFAIRIVTISYAKMVGPNCSDLEGLHESMMPSTSLPEIHPKEQECTDQCAIFRPTDRCKAPIFVFGSVGLSHRDSVTEPRVKRCYFAGVLAAILKRDLIQNPMSAMIDKILELADSQYKLFEEPKYHTEHIIKDLTLNARVMDLRDCASKLTSLQPEKKDHDDKSHEFYPAVKSQLKHFFEQCTSGLIHFSNCCYGFWYSEATGCYYYLDPYQCDAKGKRVDGRGSACLGIFASCCDMARQMCINHFEETTGFFIHRIHVEAVNPSSYPRFQEDPVWMYLDYHWSYSHEAFYRQSKKSKKCKIDAQDEKKKQPLRLKNYLIEVPNMIYSLWGSVGSFDARCGPRGGHNQAAIGVVALALQSVHHLSEWDSSVLDSAVICGDAFYKESKRTGSFYLNKFNLSECLKISPHLWGVEFGSDSCGLLYGSGDQQPNLADRLTSTFKRSSNLLLQCGKKIIAIAQTTDAFYAVDSSWTGPPLFAKNRGAVYVLRCANENTLVYVLMKMINSNQKLAFAITPVKLNYKQEVSCNDDASAKIRSAKSGSKLLDKPVRSGPGRTREHPSLVAGSLTVTDEDSYLCYSRNLKLGLERGEEFENVLLKQQSTAGKKKPESSRDKSSKKKKVCEKSSSSVLRRNVEYPRVVDLAKLDADCDTWSWDRRFDIATSFVCDETRDVFNNYNDQMQKDVYKTIKHQRPDEGADLL